jgi:hypothetical protein
VDTAARGEAVAVEGMVAVEGAGVVEAVVEVMVAAEGMVIVEVVVEMEEAVGETAGGASGKWHPDTKESSLDFARECVCTHYLLLPTDGMSCPAFNISAPVESPLTWIYTCTRDEILQMRSS